MKKHRMQNRVEACIHANYVHILVVKPYGWMPSLKIHLGLRIRSKVNWVQNNKIIDKHSFLYHLLTIWRPLHSLTLSRMYVRCMLHVLHNRDKN